MNEDVMLCQYNVLSEHSSHTLRLRVWDSICIAIFFFILNAREKKLHLLRLDSSSVVFRYGQ